ETEVGRALTDVALGHAQQQDVLRTECANCERRADARVDAARDAQHGAAPAELAHGVADAGGERVRRGLEVESERICRDRCCHAWHPTRAKVPRHPAPGQEVQANTYPSGRVAHRAAAGFASLASKRQEMASRRKT